MFLASTHSADGSKFGDIESSIETLKPVETRNLGQMNMLNIVKLLRQSNEIQCECCAMLKKYPLMKPDTWQRTKAKEWGNMTGSDKQYWIANRCNSKVGGPNKIKCPCKAFDTGFFG